MSIENHRSLWKTWNFHRLLVVSTEPREKKILLSIESWLFNRDPYIGLFQSHLINWVVCHPLYISLLNVVKQLPSPRYMAAENSRPASSFTICGSTPGAKMESVVFRKYTTCHAQGTSAPQTRGGNGKPCSIFTDDEGGERWWSVAGAMNLIGVDSTVGQQNWCLQLSTWRIETHEPPKSLFPFDTLIPWVVPPPRMPVTTRMITFLGSGIPN